MGSGFRNDDKYTFMCEREFIARDGLRYFCDYEVIIEERRKQTRKYVKNGYLRRMWTRFWDCWEETGRWVPCEAIERTITEQWWDREIDKRRTRTRTEQVSE
jgi:hypothetical protein